MDAKRRSTIAAVWAAAAAVMLLTTLPYLYGWRLQGRDAAHGWFTGYGFGAVDNAVYSSWLRSAADGAVAERNLFTTRPQSGLKFNLYYFLLGRAAGLAGLPERAAFQLSRLALGLLVLRAAWWLIGLLVEEERARWAAWLCVCFSSGLGWLWAALAPGRRPSPTDLWQPEGFTFLSLYWSPHFLAPLLLMIGMVGWLVLAERRRSTARRR